MSLSTIMTPVASIDNSTAQSRQQYFSKTNTDFLTDSDDDGDDYIQSTRPQQQQQQHQPQNYNKKNKLLYNNNKLNSVFYNHNHHHNYDMPIDGNGYNFGSSREFMTNFTKEEDAMLSMEQSPNIVQHLLHKSHSYSGSLRPKAATLVIRQDSLKERNVTSLTSENLPPFGGINDNNNRTFTIMDAQLQRNGIDCPNSNSSNSINHTSANPNSNSNTNGTTSDIIFIGTGDIDADDEEEQIQQLDDAEDAFLLPPNTTPSPTRRGGGNSRRHHCNSSSSGTSSSSSRSSLCYRVYAFITRSWYLNYLVPLAILLALMFIAYLTRDYAQRLLYWIETQNLWVIFGIFILLFVIVSFPIVVGYFVLMVTSGYLFGFFKGLPTVILGANFGIALAHITIRSVRHRIPLHRLIKNETGRAILRVISGPRAFRVVLFTRLTPIPFGLQNAIFGVSSINPRIYHAATFLGLLPAQIINVYLGSTLRSMHEVLSSHGTAITGYISFGIEVVCGVALMFWVVQKARKELSETLLSCSTEKKVIDIQV